MGRHTARRRAGTHEGRTPAVFSATLESFDTPVRLLVTWSGYDLAGSLVHPVFYGPDNLNLVWEDDGWRPGADLQWASEGSPGPGVYQAGVGLESGVEVRSNTVEIPS